MGGTSARHSSYTERAQQILQTLQNLGIEPLLDVQDYSCVLTSFKLPPGYSYEQIHDTLKESGFVIYAGQGGLKNQIFRIANMGDIQPSDLDRLLDCFHALFKPSRMAYQ